MSDTSKTPLSYRDAGVDIEAGERLVEAIGPLAKATARAGVMGGLGGFGALFDLKASGYEDPVLVSGTDGVGTKLMLAFETGIHNTVGIDLVAMCANDVLAQGAEPLFFLDYFATGKLEAGIAEAVVAGIAEGCRQSGCALVGGETAEMPGMYPPGHYDLAGFVVGAVDRAKVLPRMGDMAAGDVLIGIASSGPHSNGYSLIRRIVEREGLSYEAASPFSDGTLGEALLTPTRLYSAAALPLIKGSLINGLAHITGGGLTENTPRMCPDHLVPRIDRDSWTPGPVFQWLQEAGGVELDEMHRTFNMGIGMVFSVEPDMAEIVMNQLRLMGETPVVLGDLAPRMTRLKLAILISGRGSNMEAILEAARDPAYPAQPVLVLSNRPDAKGLETATAAGIATAAIDHKTYGKDREAFERAMHEQLTEAGVEIIALAGFMRVLTPWFVNKWQGRMVNIHPSLLPKYKGLDTHQRALDAGDTEAGCTVHWVSPGVDDGEIIQQASLPILPGDTADSLAARLLPVEHRLYPEALTKACAEIQTRA